MHKLGDILLKLLFPIGRLSFFQLFGEPKQFAIKMIEHIYIIGENLFFLNHYLYLFRLQLMRALAYILHTEYIDKFRIQFIP